MKNEAEAYFRREISTATGNEAKRMKKKKKKPKAEDLQGRQKMRCTLFKLKSSTAVEI